MPAINSPVKLRTAPTPSPVIPEKYRLSGIIPGVDSLVLGLKFEGAVIASFYYSVNISVTERKAKSQKLKAKN
jgi:hypothetical protein